MIIGNYLSLFPDERGCSKTGSPREVFILAPLMLFNRGMKDNTVK